MKKALMLASVASMIEKFNMDNIAILEDSGYVVDVAANFETGIISSKEQVEEFKSTLISNKKKVFNISVPRKISNISAIRTAYKQVKKICNEEQYNIIHCHSPIGGVIARLAARKARKNCTKVIYTAHGFHFFKGAPLKNWIIYFPVEWICSFFTDVLITINTTDYAFAKRHMRAKRIEYIPGVGIDTEKIASVKCDRYSKRKELEIPENNIAVLSVGELNDNKNHETVLKAIASLDRNDVTYVICGIGDKKEYLQKLAKDLGVEDNLILLGYRSDITEICKCCDIFAFPSKREGLGLAALEAMAAGLPIVTSNVHGIPDYSQNGITGFSCSPMNTEKFAEHIYKLAENEELRLQMGNHNKETVKKFDIKNVREYMNVIYEKV